MYTSSTTLRRTIIEKRRQNGCRAASQARTALSFIIIAFSLAFVSCATQKKTETTGTIHEKEPETPPPVDNSTQGILTRISRLLAQRKYAQALILFDDIDPVDAETARIQLIKASIHNAAGESAKARVIADGILADQPENTEALFVLAASAVVDGKEKDQRAILERVIKIDPKNIKALCDLGYIALRSQSIRTAANYFDQALAVDNKYGEALIGRAIIYRYNHEPKKSEQLLNQAIRLYPQWASPLNERARLYKGAGFLKEALADLDAAKKLEPDNYWISIDRGITLVELFRRKEALEEFSHAISMDPKNFLAYVYSAGIKDDFGDIAGADSDYSTVIKLKPEYYFASEGLGIIKMKQLEWAQARDCFLAAYKSAPKDYGYALLAAVNWMRAGKINDPKQFLEQVLRTVPRESAEWYILKLYHDLAGDVDVTIRAEKEKNFDSKAKMLFYLANYYDIRGNKNLADKYFLQVQELDRRGIPEWRINEWFIEQRGLKI